MSITDVGADTLVGIGADSIRLLGIGDGRVQQFGPASEVMKAMQRQAQAMVGEKAA